MKITVVEYLASWCGAASTLSRCGVFKDHDCTPRLRALGDSRGGGSAFVGVNQIPHRPSYECHLSTVLPTSGARSAEQSAAGTDSIPV